MRIFASSSETDSSENSLFARPVLWGVVAGLLFTCIAVFFGLMFWAKHTPDLMISLPLSLTVVLTALITGPFAVLQILMGVRGSYYAFLCVTVLILFAAFIYVQIKYVSQRFWPYLAALDVFLLFVLLWLARLIAW